jgi:hypothetical protein
MRLVPFPLQRINLLPYFHPLQLLTRKWLSGALERFRHNITEFRAKGLDDEHSFPIGDGETRAVTVEDEDSGVHLKENLLESFKVSKEGFGGWDLRRSAHHHKGERLRILRSRSFRGRCRIYVLISSLKRKGG